MAKHFNRSIERRLWLATALVAASGAAACSDSTGNARSANQLAFSMAPLTTATAATASVVPVTKNGHTLDLTQVSLTVERAKLKPVHDAVCAGDDEDEQGDAEHHDGTSGSEHGDDDCASVKVGPTTIALPLTGSVVTVPADSLPAGTFHEIEVRISQLHLVGTFDGQAFDVTLPINVRTEIEFETPLVVTAGTATSITVNVPVADWLVNTDGSLLDPSKVASNSSLLTQLRNRIAASLRAFEDRDHDGHDDHHGRDHG